MQLVQIKLDSARLGDQLKQVTHMEGERKVDWDVVRAREEKVQDSGEVGWLQAEKLSPGHKRIEVK
eukprot:1091887-Pelagomonas_calceolata.AAC.1